MNDQPETISAILADFRQFALRAAEEDKMISPESVLLLADKAEAAAERERDEDRQLAAIAESDEAFARCARCDRPERAPGNAAALRKALEGIEDDCLVLDRKDMWEEEGECYYDALRDIREKVNTALSAPARNVDRFATAEEAVAAFADHLRAWENAHGICSEYPDHAVKVPAGAFAWLFATAQEGGAE